MIDTTAALKVTGLTKSFETAAGELHVLKDVELQLAHGEAIAILGPSGSGKSTLLYLVGLLDQPTSGEIEILGEHPFQMSAADQARFRGSNIGFVFQDHHLLPQCSVLENVLVPTLATGGAKTAQVNRAQELLERVGLQSRREHQPSQLSGGERQRVAVCRALMNAPRLILADEPTGNLDQRSADVVGSLLLELSREQQTTLICVTHNRDLAGRFPQQFELVDGRLVRAER
jgi:lipoprotein-releasing system ATP-binding protein